ncbi:MAG TPA: hypothetical protein VL400_19005 [Polyangiaceae bacterium]|jgi:hypothetical protein|nr:hypothetical protein [Polyangiaceae bacterium]
MSDEKIPTDGRTATIPGGASALPDTTEPKPLRPRRVVKSAATSERSSFETPAEPAAQATPAADAPASAPSADGAPSGDAGGASSQKKWDFRRERTGEAPARPRRRFGTDERAGVRPGASGGRATPDLPRRGPVDRASPDFVDRWLSQPARKPEDRPFRKDRGPRPEGAPEGQRREGDPGARPPRGDRPRGDRPAAKPSMPGAAKAPLPAPSQPKTPTLHETILVGLPKVATVGNDKSQNKPKTAKEALAAKTAAAPKKKADGEAKSNEVVLDPSWIASKGAAAIAALSGAGPAAEALVDAWLQANNVEAIADAAASEALSGPARKAARRALSVLKSRGVAVPERASAPAAAIRVEEEVVTEATFSPPDGRGRISVTVATRRGTERAHIAEVIVREGVGVIDAYSGWMSRSQIKEAHQRIAESTGVSPAAVPAEWVRWRVAEALKDNPKSGQLVPLSIEKCKDLLEPTPASPPKHPVADLEPAGEGAAADAPAALHSEPEIRSWVADARALDDLLRSVGARLAGDESKDPTKVDAVLSEEITAATTRFFDEKERASVARRLRDAAIAVRQRAGDDKARDVLKAARAVESAKTPGEVEFLRAFLQKGIAAMAHQGGGQLRIPR